MYNSDQKEVPNVTIVINTCDAYSDVLMLFFAALQEYWPNNIFPVVINTETNTHKDLNAIVHNYANEKGKDRWGERLLKVLNSIETDFVIMLYDDFILENYVNEASVKSCLHFLEDDPETAVFYLVNTNLPTKNGSKKADFSLVESNCDYRLNSSPAIWRKSDLIRYTGIEDNPWAWEVFGSYRTYSDNKKFYTVSAESSDIFPYNYKKGGAIYRGRWVREVVGDLFLKYKLPIDMSIRGFSENAIDESRTLRWKINFMLIGYKMVGLKSLLFVVRYFKAKFL